MKVYLIPQSFLFFLNYIFEFPPSPPSSDLPVLFSPLGAVPNVIIKFDDMLYYHTSKENFTVMPTPHI